LPCLYLFKGNLQIHAACHCFMKRRKRPAAQPGKSSTQSCLWRREAQKEASERRRHGHASQGGAWCWWLEQLQARLLKSRAALEAPFQCPSLPPYWHNPSSRRKVKGRWVGGVVASSREWGRAGKVGWVVRFRVAVVAGSAVLWQAAPKPGACHQILPQPACKCREKVAAGRQACVAGICAWQGMCQQVAARKAPAEA